MAALPAVLQEPGGPASGFFVSVRHNLQDRTTYFKDWIVDVDFQTMWEIEVHFQDSIFHVMRRLQELTFRDFCDLFFLCTRKHHPNTTKRDIQTGLSAQELVSGFVPALQEAVYKSWYTDFQIKKNMAQLNAEAQINSKLPVRVAAMKKKKEEEGPKSVFVDWESMWSIWVYDFRQPAETFWRSHPCEYFLLLERYTTALEQHDLRTALLLCQQYNMNRGKGKRQAKPSAFMIQRRPKDEKMQAVEDQLAIAKEITAAFGGKIKPKRLIEDALRDIR